MKDKIESALKEIEPEVYYGTGRFKERQLWDCIVFGKRRLQKADNSRDWKRKWFVAIVKEEEIPEGMEEEVIERMREIGFKPANTDIQYDYVNKSGECVIETCVIEFFKAEKGCK